MRGCAAESPDRLYRGTVVPTVMMTRRRGSPTHYFFNKAGTVGARQDTRHRQAVASRNRSLMK